jgi:hypothetical protein
MDFVDYSATVRGHVDVPGEARELHVQGMFVGPLCSWAAESPTLRLANVDALVIESGRGGIPELESWLEGRVAAGCIAPTSTSRSAWITARSKPLGRSLSIKA